MCSRYTLTSPMEAVRAYFGTHRNVQLAPRYNIAPTQPVPIIRMDTQGTRELVLVRWGLIPSWVKDPNDFATLVNARAETAAQKPSFRAALRYRRCIVPADGFYEWTGSKGARQPHLMRRAANDGQARAPLALAGLWEHWLGSDGSELETMAILTTNANEFMAPFHDRMPVILTPTDFERWLDCKMGEQTSIDDMLHPPASDLLEAIAVNPKVNNPGNEGPDLHRPASLL